MIAANLAEFTAKRQQQCLLDAGEKKTLTQENDRTPKDTPLEPMRSWFRRYLSDIQVVVLVMVLVGGLAILLLLGDVLGPAIASVTIAYLLDGPVVRMERLGMPRLAGVTVVWLVFIAILLGIFLILVPLLLGQIAQLARQVPFIVSELQARLLALPQAYPELVGESQINEMIQRLREELILLGQRLVTVSVALLPTLVTFALYLVLLPVMVFFFLKDKHLVIGWVTRFLPPSRPLVTQVWREVDMKVGGYVRGKFYEMVIVAAVSYLTYLLLGLDFTALLAALTGVSVLIPYLGAIAAALPVAFVAFYEWGLDDQFLWTMIAYLVIQTLDGNVLAPLLLAETVDLHPIAVIVAILIFGGIWGFWGVFFAVPLASLVQAVLHVWPKTAT